VNKKGNGKLKRETKMNEKFVNTLSILHKTASVVEATNFLNEEVSADIKAQGGITPLHFNENYKVLKLLIDRGADVNAPRDDGQTPLHIQNDSKIVQLLIDNGANVNALNMYGDTPLHLSETLEKVKLLVSNGADINILNEDNELPDDCYGEDMESQNMINFLVSMRD
jgi:ankyrin repeat protein